MPGCTKARGRLAPVARLVSRTPSYYGKRIVNILMGIVAMLAAGSAFAHHSHAMFDLDKQVTLVGTVKEFEWGNPHCWIQLLVPDPNDPQAGHWFGWGTDRKGAGYTEIMAGAGGVHRDAPSNNRPPPEVVQKARNRPNCWADDAPSRGSARGAGILLLGEMSDG